MAGAEDVVLDELDNVKVLVTEVVLGDEDDTEPLELVVETIKLDVVVDDVVGCAEAGYETFSGGKLALAKPTKKAALAFSPCPWQLDGEPAAF